MTIVSSAEAEIVGIKLHPLSPTRDRRGHLCEIHRDGWGLAPKPVQWDYVDTHPNFMRGVHVHRLRYDYIISVRGRGAIGLYDLRRDQPSFGKSMMVPVDGETPCVVIIPPGVAHGFFSVTPSSYLYGLTAYWDGLDQMGCRYDDPALSLLWPGDSPELGERDADLPLLERLLQQFEESGGVPPHLRHG